MSARSNCSARVCLLLALFAGLRLQATPYATCLTNHGNSISFRLNESATSVKILSSGGATLNDLGPLSAGIHTANLILTGPFQVSVRKLSSSGWLEGAALPISDDNNRFLKFRTPRGLAINTNPGSPHFGRIYVANAQAGTTSDNTRTNSDGLYLLNADFTDAIGQGDDALTGGITWAAAVDDTFTPWRIEVGEDGNVYIADWTTNSGSIYRVDGNVSEASGVNVLAGMGSPSNMVANPGHNHGQIPSSVIAQGSLEAGTLKIYALEGDISPINVVRLWDIGAGPLPYAGPAIEQHDAGGLMEVTGVTVDLDIGPDGKFYLIQNRFTGTEDGLVIADPEVDEVGGGPLQDEPNGRADLVYRSLADTRRITNDPGAVDFLRQARAVKLSPGAGFLAVVINNGDTWIVPLENGLPELTKRALIPTGGVATAPEVAFDAAGNLYVLNGGNQRLRVFSAGLQSTAITSSDGGFSLTVKSPEASTVEVLGEDVDIYERLADQDTAELRFTRVGESSSDLTVFFTVAGTALKGIDYHPLGSSLVIPAGELGASLTVTGINNVLIEGDKTIVVILDEGPYDIGGHNMATITLRDDESPFTTLLWSDDFESDTATNYNVVFSEDAGGNTDFMAAFHYDYSVDGIPPAPHSAGNSSRGLKLLANLAAPNSPAAVNVYPLGQSFTGDFILRADIFISVGTDLSGTAEHTLLGICHGAEAPNRHTLSSDGLWFALNGDASNSRGFGWYQGGTGTPMEVKNNTPDFAGTFTSPPWGFAGAPGNTTNAFTGTSSGRLWADAEISAIGGVVSFKINGTQIFSFTNSSPYTNGTVMVGHNDQFNSIGSPNNFTLFDNVRVLSTVIPATLDIESIRVQGINVIIDFRGEATDTPLAFALQRAVKAQGPYSPDSSAVVAEREPVGNGLFRASTVLDGGAQFYFIQK